MQHKTLIFISIACAASVIGILSTLETTQLDTPQTYNVYEHQDVELVPVESPTEKASSVDLEHAYAITAHASGTVETLMQERRAHELLTFTSRDYPSLGSFLESINGVRNADGRYWMLYINDTRSSVGMTSASVVPGDRIEWRYE